jgi:hypothetical protein
MGINTPLMKTRGNLTRLEIVMMLAGLSVGGVEKRVPRTAKQRADKITVTINKIGRLSSAPRTNTLMKIGTKDRNRPKKKAAKTSPAIRFGRVNGDVNNLSSVRVLVSKGSTAGVVADAVKNTAIPINPGAKL